MCLRQREWSTLEERIAAAETRVAAAEIALQSSAVVIDPVALQRTLVEQEEARAEVAALYARWEELAARAT